MSINDLIPNKKWGGYVSHCCDIMAFMKFVTNFKLHKPIEMKPIIDHIQVTVRDMKVAEPFYDQLMSILGFDLARKGKGTVKAHDFDVIEYVHPLLIFAINSPREAFKDDTVHRRKPGSLHHLAFKATSQEEVDELYLKIKEAGAYIVDPPKFYPQHGEKYYALFFKDPDGIKYEIVFEERNL